NLDLFGQELDPSQDPSRPPWERIHALIPKDSPLHGMTTLEAVRDYVNDTVLVPIDEARLNAVMGVGDPNADLVIIGEAPGADEDRTGEPFTGRAGQLLNKILAAIHFERQDVYITNILFWRPPGNRNPTAGEVAACLPFIERLIELVDPAVLVMVGGTAAKTLLGQSDGIMKLRGRWFNYESARMTRPIPATGIFHPAYLLRSPAQKRTAWTDLLAIKRKLEASPE
ncbi:MAG: uracil-DNA glycosylase, partial [Proteobacteria bacterium]|nr:uracil-DNA glycosylase [Pseudomonadota bacterium]